MSKMKIEIWSDIACPYCYIGKKRFEAVLDRFKHKDQVEVVWKSYELDPTLSKSAPNPSYFAYLAKGQNRTEDQIKQTTQKISSLGKEVGIEYNFDKVVLTNTSDALRLVKIAKKYDRANDAEELLFKAYFTEGKSISDRAVLVDISRQLNIPTDEVETTLDSDLFLQEIRDEIAYSEKELKLEYIPFYLFNQKDSIQGVIEPETYLSVLQESFEDWKSNGVGLNDGDTISGKACSIDGVCSL